MGLTEINCKTSNDITLKPENGLLKALVREERLGNLRHQVHKHQQTPRAACIHGAGDFHSVRSLCTRAQPDSEILRPGRHWFCHNSFYYTWVSTNLVERVEAG